jgi:hypothetical protein
MKPLGTSTGTAAARALLGLLLVASPAAGQDEIRVVFPKVKDSRARYKTNAPSTSLTVFPRVEGTGLEGAQGFRVTVAAAKDDLGNPLPPDSDGPREWAKKPDGMELWLKLKGPVREAASVTLTGTVQAWIPSRDPASEIRVEKFWATAGKPLAVPALRDARIQVTVVPMARVEEGSVVLVGPLADIDRILQIAVLRADGTPLDTSGGGSQSDGETKMVEVSHREAIPKDATLFLTVMTEKSVLSAPFETTVPLP